jgi:hypothetical protein
MIEHAWVGVGRRLRAWFEHFKAGDRFRDFRRIIDYVMEHDNLRVRKCRNTYTVRKGSIAYENMSKGINIKSLPLCMSSNIKCVMK